MGLRELGFDLGPDLVEHERDHLVVQHVVAEAIEEQALDLLDGLVDG